MASCSENKLWIGFDLGGTKMLAQVYDSQFYALGRARERSQGHEGPDAGIQRMVRLIRQALSEIKVHPEDISGVGVGVPGPLDLERGLMIEAPNLGWRNVPLKRQLEQWLRCPVVVLNDVDAGIYGEYRFGAGRGTRCVVGVFPGTGIGGGCVYEGNILRGRNRSCLEVGHMQVVSDGPVCGCGRRGCLETVASRLAIAGAVSQAAYRGDAPYVMSHAGTDLANLRSKVLSQAIQAGDRIVEQILQRAASYLGIAVANLINLLLPDRVILGGGLVEAMPELFVETVSETARQRVMPAFEQMVDVVPAALKDDATAIGAAAWAQHEFDEDTRV